MFGVPNLKDVAHAAHVHPTTASSVLNGAAGNTRFSPETRLRVESAARRLGYVRNRSAGILRGQKSHTIGLVAGNLQNPFFALLSLELEKRLQAIGYELLLSCHGADRMDDEHRLAQTLMGRSVDGMFVWSEMRGGQRRSIPHDPTCPVVFLGYAPPREVAVTIDIREGLLLAVDHLRKAGFHHIAYFAPSYAKTSGFPTPRPALLAEVCRQRGLRKPLLLFHEGESWDFATAVRGVSIHLPQVPPHTAVIGYNDVWALAWFLASRDKSGKRAPVIAFDGTPLIQALPNGPTYVDLRAALVAENAVEMLVQLLRGERLRSRRRAVVPVIVPM